MADISDVETAMVTRIAGSLGLGRNYLGGSAVSSHITGGRCRVYRGWPIAAQLDPDMAAGISHVTVFPVAGSTRRTTRYVPQWTISKPVEPTMTATVAGNTVTIGGTPSPSQIVGIRYGGLAGKPHAYRPGPRDTVVDVARALAAIVPAATLSGAAVTLPGNPWNLVARVGVDQTAWIETRRQEQNLWVIAWCPTPLARDAVAGCVDAGFAGMMDDYGSLTDQFPLPDGSSARLLYISNHTDDQAQRAGIWRRDLRYVVSYPTTLVQTLTPMLFGGGTVVPGYEGQFAFGDLHQADEMPANAPPPPSLDFSKPSNFGLWSFGSELVGHPTPAAVPTTPHPASVFTVPGNFGLWFGPGTPVGPVVPPLVPPTPPPPPPPPPIGWTFSAASNAAHYFLGLR